MLARLLATKYKMYFLIWGNNVVNEDFIVINVPKQALEENEFNEYKNRNKLKEKFILGRMM
uniref:Uncharacterized protein n=1 Tax=Meloidogyne enterolobii TaxID=390850 RepID=A0A6V7VGF1_MELEN|nr:unnamed protein product [Meloidogyne enterolobii]